MGRLNIIFPSGLSQGGYEFGERLARVVGDLFSFYLEHSHRNGLMRTEHLEIIQLIGVFSEELCQGVGVRPIYDHFSQGVGVQFADFLEGFGAVLVWEYVDRCFGFLLDCLYGC